MKEKLINLLLAIVATGLGLVVYYFAPISSQILEKVDFDGKLTKEQAEIKVEEAGFYPMYSWYQVLDFKPYVIVMSQNEDGSIEDKVMVNAFSGEIEKYGQLKE